MIDPKDIEIVERALQAASKHMNCDDWGEIDLNGEGAMGAVAHDIIAMPEGCPACKVRDAIVALSRIKEAASLSPVHTVGLEQQNDEGDRSQEPSAGLSAVSAPSSQDAAPIPVAEIPKRRTMCKQWPHCGCIARGTVEDCIGHSRY